MSSKATLSKCTKNVPIIQRIVIGKRVHCDFYNADSFPQKLQAYTDTFRTLQIDSPGGCNQIDNETSNLYFSATISGQTCASSIPCSQPQRNMNTIIDHNFSSQQSTLYFPKPFVNLNTSANIYRDSQKSCTRSSIFDKFTVIRINPMSVSKNNYFFIKFRHRLSLQSLIFS